MSGTFGSSVGGNSYGAAASGRRNGPSGWGDAPEPGPTLRRLWDAWWAMPKAFRVVAMVLGFIAWWPIGLALLLMMAATGRLGRSWSRGAARGGQGCGPRRAPDSSGNRAFDDYREETLRRLEEEQREFTSFLDRLRVAKDKAEFDQFMTERRRPAAPEPQA